MKYNKFIKYGDTVVKKYNDMLEEQEGEPLYEKNNSDNMDFSSYNLRCNIRDNGKYFRR